MKKLSVFFLWFMSALILISIGISISEKEYSTVFWQFMTLMYLVLYWDSQKDFYTAMEGWQKTIDRQFDARMKECERWGK